MAGRRPFGSFAAAFAAERAAAREKQRLQRAQSFEAFCLAQQRRVVTRLRASERRILLARAQRPEHYVDDRVTVTLRGYTHGGIGPCRGWSES